VAVEHAKNAEKPILPVSLEELVLKVLKNSCKRADPNYLYPKRAVKS
jgi:hypothetical protein